MEVEELVTGFVNDFFKGMSQASCEDGEPVSRFAKDGSIYVLDDEVITVSLQEYEEGVKYRACNWTKHGGGVDSILVDVLSPHAANSAWTYHDIIAQKDGKIRQTKGAVLQTWVDEGEGWKISATMTAETLISLE